MGIIQIPSRQISDIGCRGPFGHSTGCTGDQEREREVLLLANILYRSTEVALSFTPALWARKLSGTVTAHRLVRNLRVFSLNKTLLLSETF